MYAYDFVVVDVGHLFLLKIYVIGGVGTLEEVNAFVCLGVNKNALGP